MLARGVNMLNKVARSHSKSAVIANCSQIRTATTSPSGSILPEPKKPRFGYIGVICAVTIGLFIGATISKNVANFLEENELFVPSDDDDDD